LSYLSVEADERPNILFLVADDLGYEMVGCYGSLEVETPRIDQLASEGMRFARAYGSPVCTPTRMSFYTGEYPTRHGYTRVLPVHEGTREAVDFRERFASYAQLLRRAGYATSVTGKWQLAALEFHPEHMRDAGFDSWCVWQIWRDGAKTTRYWDPCLNHDGAIRDDVANRFGPDVLTDYVIAQMKRAIDEGRPFCIQHNIMLPHLPIVATPPEKESGEAPSLRHMITYMDALIGRIVDAVDALGIAENTCIVFLGDNGTDVATPRQTRAGTVTGGKRTLDDGGTHLPLVVRWPGAVPNDTVVPDLVDVTDFLPTFCELAGVPVNRPIDGQSFAPRLLENQPNSRAVVVAGLQDRFSVFDGDYRLDSNGTVLDARQLPAETLLEGAEADRVRRRLETFLPENADR